MKMPLRWQYVIEKMLGVFDATAGAGFASLDSGGLVPSSQGGMPVGAVIPSAPVAAPAGWLLCDGSAISRTTYARLYAALGVVYGAGDGVTTFNLPDLRGRTPIGAGAGPSLTTRAPGDKGGAETHQLTVGEIPEHDHKLGYTGSGSYHPIGAGVYALDASIGTGPAGGNGAHNNMQPWAALNFIIKT